jgi:hypothetical protein
METAIEKAEDLINKFGKELAPKVVDEMVSECKHWLTSDKCKRVHWEEKRLDYLAELKQKITKKNKMETKVLDTVYFQPKGFNKNYCEIGIILDSDKDYIHYLNEPCKVAINEVKLIDKSKLIFLKNGLIKLKTK